MRLYASLLLLVSKQKSPQIDPVFSAVQIPSPAATKKPLRRNGPQGFFMARAKGLLQLCRSPASVCYCPSLRANSENIATGFARDFSLALSRGREA